MRSEVEPLSLVGLWLRQNVLDILGMSSGTQVDEDHAQRDECNL
jgi:hypothetical protein